MYQAPSFDHQQTKITAVSRSAVSLKSFVVVKNTNPYALPITELTAKLQLAGEDWIILENNPIKSLPAHRSTTITLEWSLVYDELIARAADAFKQGIVHFTLLLEPTLSVPLLGARTLQWQAELTLQIPKLPILSIVDWQVTQLSLTGVELSFDLALFNPNVFAIQTQDWQARVQQNHRSLAFIVLPDAQLSAQAHSHLRATVSLSLVDVGIVLVNAMQTGQWPSQLSFDWQGHWSSSDLGAELPDLAGKLL